MNEREKQWITLGIVGGVLLTSLFESADLPPAEALVEVLEKLACIAIFFWSMNAYVIKNSWDGFSFKRLTLACVAWASFLGWWVLYQLSAAYPR